MQTILEITILSNLAATCLSVTVSLYLLRTWMKQESRLITDLPLVFGVAFMAQAFNTFQLALSTVGLIEMTLEVFRVRALVISASVVPLTGILLTIWLPKLRKYYSRIMFGVAAYLAPVSLFGPTQEIIMTLIIPVILVILIGIILTFTVTWKTGRLKEVRSDFMVISTVLMFISQLGKVPLTSLGLVFVADLITGISTMIAALGITNPWYNRQEPLQIEQPHTLSSVY